MKKLYLKDLPNHKDLIGKKINIIRQGGKYHYDYQDIPMIREFRGAKFKTEKGVKSIEWYWKPEPITGERLKRWMGIGQDCGWSGIEIDTEYHKDSYLLV